MLTGPAIPVGGAKDVVGVMLICKRPEELGNVRKPTFGIEFWNTASRCVDRQLQQTRVQVAFFQLAPAATPQDCRLLYT